MISKLSKVGRGRAVRSRGISPSFSHGIRRFKTPANMRIYGLEILNGGSAIGADDLVTYPMRTWTVPKNMIPWSAPRPWYTRLWNFLLRRDKWR